MDLVVAWVRKAESDLKIGKDEMATDAPATDGICFHMQPCVEKYIKAFLVMKNRDFRKTHEGLANPLGNPGFFTLPQERHF